MFNGAVSVFWLREGGIRFRLSGVVEESEFAAPFSGFRDIEVDLIMTGHSPFPVEDAQRAIQKVLVEGQFEKFESGNSSYLWIQL